jgi:undecaprenyl-diphosphatase
VNLFHALVLGIVEGITEFLPVSSTAHLTILEKLFGLNIDDPGVTAFTAIIQVGAIVAVVAYFRRDIVRLVAAWVRGLARRDQRGQDYRLAWFVIVGTIPIGVVGLLGRHLVAGPLRNLWVVAAALVVWSAVMWLAECSAARVGDRQRDEGRTTLGDAMVIGLVQCIALVPGVSRSGATISAGLFRGLDRVAATRLSFLLSIPALVAAGGFEAATSYHDVATGPGWAATGVAAVVSLVVAYTAIAWLLRLVQHHPITVFNWYRITLAGAVAVFLVATAPV